MADLFSNVTSDPAAGTPDTVHYFVDEAGTPTLFGRRRKVIIGQDGCSKYFILGKLDVDEPVRVSAALEELRRELVSDPYFKNVPSMQPAYGKTAVAFHAKDDRPEVRYEVFKLLRTLPVSFYAVVRDKMTIVEEVHQQSKVDAGYRYRENDLYDALVEKLFNSRFYKADVFEITFAERGNKPRTEALTAALAKARQSFKTRFGYQSEARVEVTPSTPKQTACLQVVDYYLWALQRFYERGEDQYLNVIWPHTKLVHDLDDHREKSYGVCYSPQKPLTLTARMIERKTKSRRI